MTLLRFYFNEMRKEGKGCCHSGQLLCNHGGHQGEHWGLGVPHIEKDDIDGTALPKGYHCTGLDETFF